MDTYLGWKASVSLLQTYYTYRLIVYVSEYDVNQPKDPSQTFAFLPSTSTSSRFTAVDPLSRYATSFAFGIGKYDFGPFMVHVLVADGDVYTMGPILPLHTELPLRYLQVLKAYSDRKSERLKRFDDEDEEEYLAKLSQSHLQSQWVDSLTKQVKDGEEARRSEEEDEIATPSKRGSFYSSRLPQTGSNVPLHQQPSPVAESTMRVHPPHLTDTGGPAPGASRAIARQGPWVYHPSPQDVGAGADEEEQVASDLHIGRCCVPVGQGEGDDEAEREEIVLVAIAWSGGRVDLGVVGEKPEPQWITSKVSTQPV